jgi:hypothetical protein
MLNFRKIDAEEYYGDGHGARHAQRGSQETLQRQTKLMGQKRWTKRTRSSGEFMSQKRPGARKYKGVRREGKRQG